MEDGESEAACCAREVTEEAALLALLERAKEKT
ncbi:MAG: hypothetical protein IJ662_01765 [Clostridia bacterium]|nr:hypothetical protein [Clostridia bacterium]